GALLQPGRDPARGTGIRAAVARGARHVDELDGRRPERDANRGRARARAPHPRRRGHARGGHRMNALLVMIPLSLVLLVGAAAAFFWAVDHDQFDDMDAPALLPLEDPPDS